MKKFARTQTVDRLKKLDAALRQAARHPEEDESVHDLRVAIRRFAQCLEVFQQFFDQRAAQKIRRRLRKLMDRCAAVRNCDVALELLRGSGTEDPTLTASIAAVRAEAEHTLAASLKRWRHRSIRKTWPQRLEAHRRRGVWVPGHPPLEAAGAAL